MEGDILGLVAMVVVVIGLISLNYYADSKVYKLPKDQWQCTASRVINDTLPREEECVQYSKKEK